MSGIYQINSHSNNNNSDKENINQNILVVLSFFFACCVFGFHIVFVQIVSLYDWFVFVFCFVCA